MIRLYSYKNNFGDDLSPYIISKLTGDKVVYRKPFSIKRCSLDLMRFFKTILFKKIIDSSLLKYSPFHKTIISIGSILEESTSNTIVWGAGIGSRNIKIKGGTFLAVRGPLSQQRLAELGFNVPNAVGDPAILLPIIYPYKSNSNAKKFKIGIIPHKSDYEDLFKIIHNHNVKEVLILNLLEPNLEKVIDEIISCDYILSSSLHGLIVAHAYNIPAIRFINNKLFGDGSKFIDYFSSVNISNYDPIQMAAIDFTDIDNIISLFEDLAIYSLPKVDLLKMQNALINAAPFKVKEKYNNV